MGILNATPDSFSDGGKFRTPSDAIAQAEHMIANGVDMIDIGGESTRPGAEPVSLQEELDRVLPVIEALKDCGVALSIDTYKAETMRQALHAGVDCVNDIWALRQEGAVEAIIESDERYPNKQCGLILMHMQRDPQTMQFDPEYQDLIAEVNDFLRDDCSHGALAPVLAPSSRALGLVGVSERRSGRHRVLTKKTERIKCHYLRLT